MPKLFAALVSWALVSRSDSVVNAVEQPAAKSVLNVGSGPSPRCFGWFVKVRPPTSFALWHGTCVFTLRPLASSAAVETIVNAGPGG